MNIHTIQRLVKQHYEAGKPISGNGVPWGAEEARLYNQVMGHKRKKFTRHFKAITERWDSEGETCTHLAPPYRYKCKTCGKVLVPTVHDANPSKRGCLGCSPKAGHPLAKAHDLHVKMGKKYCTFYEPAWFYWLGTRFQMPLEQHPLNREYREAKAIDGKPISTYITLMEYADYHPPAVMLMYPDDYLNSRSGLSHEQWVEVKANPNGKLAEQLEIFINLDKEEV